MTAPAPSWTTPACVTRVIDGDTLEVEVVRVLRVRIRDCWAPETRTKDLGEKARGLEAKAALEKLIEEVGPGVTIQIPTEGDQALASVFSFGRVLGDVWAADGRSVAEVMVGLGLATEHKEPEA